jgi:hypothetical protein
MYIVLNAGWMDRGNDNLIIAGKIFVGIIFLVIVVSIIKRLLKK